MNGELIRIINYDKPRRPVRDAWARARARFARLVLLSQHIGSRREREPLKP